MTNYLARYSLNYLKTLLYMLQVSEYRTGRYIAWLNRTKDFKTVTKRQRLVATNKVKLLLLFQLLFIVVFFGGIISLLVISFMGTALDMFSAVGATVIAILIFPMYVAYSLLIPLWLGEQLVQRPMEKKIIQQGQAARSQLDATVIAIAGSYGKTTFKESLKTILEQGKTVAATPGNKNTMLSVSAFLKSIDSKPEVVICEFGEEYVGDVEKLAQLTRPDVGVITGINQAHLETFGNIENTINTIFALQDFLQDKPLYKNIDNSIVKERAGADAPYAYSIEGCNGWVVSDVTTSLHGTSFTATKGDQLVTAKSQLIGCHQVGPLVACIDIASSLGLSVEQIGQGIAKTQAFEHRMQPYMLSGAMVVDDTYNGNIDGVLSGLALLKQESGRRIYVTPGLVEQGSDTIEVHQTIGQAMAEACDVAVLMNNSVTQYIQQGLEKGAFKGKIMVVDNPLEFYQNLDQFVAHGDVVLMQNDWTDNYF